MPIDGQLLRLERWKKRFIDEVDAIDAFLVEYPAGDSRTLKPLIRKARAMHHHHGTPRFLLRCIRALDDARQAQACVPPTVSASISSDG
jgi:ribosomal 50S subunit-associated protein YjgA (DUF615 family)